ncbi:MAG: hypothetical protein V7641_1846 [Blastocatellia bacterium]
MKNGFSKTIVEIDPSTDSQQQLREESFFELREDVSESDSLETNESCQFNGIIVGILVGLKETGTPLVDFPTNICNGPIAARSTVALTGRDLGREIVLAFEEGHPKRPVVMGLIQNSEAAQSSSLAGHQAEKENPIELEADGEKLLLSANKEIALRCGKGSITIQSDGKIIIRGTYLLSRSSGLNKIKGGAVQIN